MDLDKMNQLNINPYIDCLSGKKYRELFGERVYHPFTGIDYVQLYKDLTINNDVEIYLCNDPKMALDYTKDLLVANIHNRKRTKEILKEAGAEKVYGLDDLLTEPAKGRATIQNTAYWDQIWQQILKLNYSPGLPILCR